MDGQNSKSSSKELAPIAFKAETRQLLDILIHSLYTEREIFLRELISNASDALTRIDFEVLTNRQVLDPDAELVIRIKPNKEEKTLTIEDSGIGMTSEELSTNLGTIAHSGAREFLQEASQSGRDISELIGQFGVGFYSAFMVAEWIRVTSRSYLVDSQATSWFSAGADTFTLEPAEKSERGTQVTIKLKEEAEEFLAENRLAEVVRKHSDFIPFPIYIGEQKEQVNRQTAIWRQSPREVDEKEYNDFYQSFTLDIEPPLIHAHMVVDAPVQMYAILYVPASPERSIFTLRRQEGLKLYARKVLIQEYNRELLPEYLGFVQGVVDSEDLPLNVSRESVQSNRLMAQIKKLITSKVVDSIAKLASDDVEKYNRFWVHYARYIKQGIAIEQSEPEALYPLLRFHTTSHPDVWSSLDDYIERMAPEQTDIYYILGDDERSLVYSPHLDIVHRLGYEALLLADPVDAFMLVRLSKYKDQSLSNVATSDLSMPEEKLEQADDSLTKPSEDELNRLVDRFKNQLGERVSDVRLTKRLVDSPARLIDPEGTLNQEMQRVYRMLDRGFEAPKKVMELNPSHPILVKLSSLPEEDPRCSLVIEQVYENALLIEGLHPDPAGMIARLQKIMQAALE